MVSKNVTRLGAFPSLGIKAPVETIANLDIVLSGHQVIDKVATTNDMRVLVAGQIDASENGIYNALSGPWVRADDWNVSADVIRGTIILNVFRKAMWMIEFTDTEFNLDTSLVSFQLMVGTVGIAAETDSNFDPGYSVTFVSTTSFTVDGFNVVNLFYVNRRIRFEDRFGAYTFGIIDTSVFGTDTTITLTMEGTDTVPDPLSRAILTSSDVQWAPVSPNQHPFIAMNKATVVSGRIGVEDWWVIVGSNGFIATSNDLGASWTQRIATGGLTTEDINDISYDYDNERFMAVADNTFIITSADGVNWISSQPSDLTDAITVGDGRLVDITYGGVVDGEFFIMGGLANTVSDEQANSTDFGANWNTPGNGLLNRGAKRVVRHGRFTPGGRYLACAGNTSTKADHTTAGWTNEDSNPNHTNVAFEEIQDIALTVGPGGAIRKGQQGGQGFWNVVEPAGTGSFGTTNLLGIAFAILIDRWVVVGEDGKIGYAERASNTVWTLATNGFNPTSHILDVHYNENDAIFIAISNDGVICRSTNGIT